jgi:hypothetical protein
MKFVFHIYFCLKCIVIVLRSLYTSLLGMSEAILARELGLTSMRLQDSYLMIRSLESELESSTHQIQELKNQISLMQLLINGFSIQDQVESEEYQP